MSDRGEDTTVRPPPALRDDPTRACRLTVVFHPDVDRIGEVACLADYRAGHEISLGREDLEFASPRGGSKRPLGDRRLSRTPLLLEITNAGGLRIHRPPTSVDVRVQDAPLVREYAASSAEVEAGLVIELANSVVLLAHKVGPSEDHPDDLGLIGANETVDELRRNIVRVADMVVPVLIRGETGTGKELVARAVHNASKRAHHAFVGVNMAAIPTAMAASELFGHRKGAFTGAVDDHPGYFAQAHEGTLFLDEIGATPSEIQPMLLRALETREMQPLGSGTPRPIDVRLVAATDADLERAIADDSFRAALLHRLEGYQLFLPPLRERRDDIGRLLLHFLKLELSATGELDRLAPRPADQRPWFPASLAARLAMLDWPGNVRQLRNVVRQLAISSRGAEHVRIDSALSRLLDLAALRAPTPQPTPPAAKIPGPDEDAVIDALRAHGWQPNKAAAHLGISRSTMYERIKQSTRIRQAKQIEADEIVACQQACGGDLAAMAAELEVSTRALTLRMRKLGLRSK